MKKKLFYIVNILSIFFLLIACSSEQESGGTSGKTEITFIGLTDWEPALTRVIAAFEEENPDIKVNFESYSFDGLFEAIEVKLGSKSSDFDILAVDVPLVANYTVKGFLEPLTSYFDESKLDKLIESAVDAGSYNGEFMAPPINTSGQVLYYNKDLFEAKGITPPSFDTNERWNWEQVVDVAKQLTEDENGDGITDVFGFTFDQVDRPYQILPLPQSLGADVLGKDGLQVKGNFDSEEMIEAGQFYYDLFNEWGVSPKIKPDTTPEYFKNGDVAMFLGGTWNVPNFEGVNFGIAPHPYFEGGEIATPTGSWHMGISAFSKKKDAAAKFIEFVSIGEGSRIYFEERNQLPATKELLEEITSDPKYDEFPNNAVKLAAYEAQNTAVPRPSSPGYSEFQSVFGEAYENIKNGQSPEEALKAGAEKLERLIEKYRNIN